MFPKLSLIASTLPRFLSCWEKETWFVPKKVIPIHAVARLVFSFSTFLRSAFRPHKLQSIAAFPESMTHRLDDDTSGTVAYEEDGPCFGV